MTIWQLYQPRRHSIQDRSRTECNHIETSMLPRHARGRFDARGRFNARGASTMIVAVCRPGSQPTSNTFYSEFTKILELFVACSSPTIMTSDINVHLEKPDDVDSRNFSERKLSMIELGGLFDVIIAPQFRPHAGHLDRQHVTDCTSVRHRSPATVKNCVISKTSSADWRCRSCVHQVIKMLASINLLIALMKSSPVYWTNWHRRRRSYYGRVRRQPYFDKDCRNARKKTRRLQRIFIADRKPESRSNWRTALRCSRRLAQSKATSFWKDEINSR